jgi:hypothetical protein
MTRLQIPLWMHLSRERVVSLPRLALLLLCALGVTYGLVVQPLGSLVVISGILALGWLLDRPRGSRRARGEHEARLNEDFGSFTSAFDERGLDPLDPWALRAVWDAVLPLTALGGPVIPLRPTDRFDLDLGVDPEEVVELIPSLVERCGRAMGNWSANPYYAGLSTVGALVHFISAQPLAEQSQRIAVR